MALGEGSRTKERPNMVLKERPWVRTSKRFQVYSQATLSKVPTRTPLCDFREHYPLIDPKAEA